ncbi:MAG: hypothetical protein WD847_14500 [Pirellulales bacterium]
MVATTAGDLIRLDAIAKHLGTATRWGDEGFEQEAITECLTRIRPVVVGARAQSGEHVIAALATHYAVHFEEVHDSRDIDALEEKYLKKQRELGFGRLRDELEDPSVDALLIQRIEARSTDPDKWVAVLNLQRAPSANAVVKHWPRPAMLLTAALNGRKNAPQKDRELRVVPQARNTLARAAGLFVIPNMRIPRTSPAYAAFVENGRADDFENLATWTTSSGKSLAHVRAFVSAMKLADIIYVMVSL